MLDKIGVDVGDTVTDGSVIDVAGETDSLATGVLGVEVCDELAESAARPVSLAHDVTNNAVAASNT